MPMGPIILKSWFKMLCLFLDAFKPEYLKYAPNIRDLAKENLHGELEVPLGFTSILASFFTGKNPDKHGIMDIFEKSDFKSKIKNKFIINSIRLIKNNKFFYSPLKIKEIKYFKPSLEKAWPQKNSLKIPTLFDILEQNNISFTSIDWPNHYTNRKGKIFFNKSAENILKLTQKVKTQFIFAHFMDLEVAHKYGVNSNETMEAIKKIDDIVGKLDQKNLIIFSDHGMDDIENKFDLKLELDNLNLIYGEDYIYFLGSTMVRFWFKNEYAENKVINLLKNIEQGKIVNFEEYNLPNTCDLIFLADFKTIFYPNFFNTNYKAMHGWDPKIQKAFYLIKGFKGKKNKHIVDLLPYILKILDIQ